MQSARTETRELVEELTVGFDALQDEYRELHGRYSGLGRKLQTAREQYNALAKLLPNDRVATPPLSLASSPRQQGAEFAGPPSIADLLDQQERPEAQHAADRVRRAGNAAETLRSVLPSRSHLLSTHGEGVTIWSGPAADHPSKPASSSMMPSISESPLEQDFTIEGKPSRLGCPFASMAGKKLSSHAASVLSRYNTREGGSGAGGTASAAMSSAGVSRVNGRESWSQRDSRRESFRDPIKAEICGMSDHHHNAGEEDVQHGQHESGHQADLEASAPPSECAAATSVANQPDQHPESAEPGVCPIRFLDQHSPEEVATYFEKHKHELPRSHEVCVRRYQSNEEQIRELDAKYGNLVSMIQGLGKKHKDYLPNEPDPEAEDFEGEEVFEEAKDNEKVRRWASSVSAQAPGDINDDHDNEFGEEHGQEEERLQHFERPLRDIRVGESPSRPWGISVPTKYLVKHEGRAGSDASNRPVQNPAAVSPAPFTKGGDISPRDREAKKDGQSADTKPAVGRCPFGFDKAPRGPPTSQPAPAPAAETNPHATGSRPALAQWETAFRTPAPQSEPAQKQEQRLTFIASPAHPQLPTTEQKTAAEQDPAAHKSDQQQPRMIFTGPVFIGYSAEDAVKILRESGLGGVAGGQGQS